MGNNNEVSNKNKQLSNLFGNTIRSKIVTILLDGKEIKSSDINKNVNLFGKECGLSIIQEHITDLKREGFVTRRREGKYVYWKINSSGNVFLNNFCNLMKAPKAQNSSSVKKIRKNTEEWIVEIKHAINSITKRRSGGKFTPTQIRTMVNVESQRLNQILNKMIEMKIIDRVEEKRGLYYVKVAID